MAADYWARRAAWEDVAGNFGDHPAQVEGGRYSPQVPIWRCKFLSALLPRVSRPRVSAASADAAGQSLAASNACLAHEFQDGRSPLAGAANTSACSTRAAT